MSVSSGESTLTGIHWSRLQWSSHARFFSPSAKLAGSGSKECRLTNGERRSETERERERETTTSKRVKPVVCRVRRRTRIRPKSTSVASPSQEEKVTHKFSIFQVDLLIRLLLESTRKHSYRKRQRVFIASIVIWMAAEASFPTLEAPLSAAF